MTRSPASTPRRLLGAVAALALVGGAASFWPAHAMTKTGFEVAPDKGYSGTFGPLVGNDAKAALNFNPTFCATVTFCDVIPFKVNRPAGADPDTITVNIEVSWDDPTTTNDVDIDLYDNKQLDTTYTRLTRDESTSNPSRVRLSRAALVDYNLVVRNVIGMNLGYTVKASVSTRAFTSPFELLAPKREEARTPPTTAAPAPVESLPPPASVADSGGPPPTLAPVSVAADSDFDFGNSGFENQLAAPPPSGGVGGAAPALTKPAKVGGGVVALWFVIAPLLLLGATAAFFLRRRSRGDGFA